MTARVGVGPRPVSKVEMRLLARGAIVVVVGIALVGCANHSIRGVSLPAGVVSPPTATAVSGISAQQAPDPIGILGHSGRWITDHYGRVLMFHGVNMVAKRPPYEPSAVGFGADDAHFLAANGFTLVRLGVIFKAVEPQPGQYDERYLDQIATTVDVLGQAGIRSLLDFHQDAYNEVFGGEGFPDWTVPPLYRGPFESRAEQGRAMYKTIDAFWTNEPRSDGFRVQEAYASAVAHVAARFATNSDVLGYDLINEPMPGFLWPQCRSTPVDCSGFDHELGAFQQRLIAAIRGVDPAHLIWYEPNTLFDWGLPTRLPRFADTRLGMSFHDYCPPAVTCERRLQLRNAVLRSHATGDALMLTEFWSLRSDAAGVTDAADDDLTPWITWAYCGCGDPTGSIPPEVEGLVRDPMHAPSGDNVDSSKLQILARPYPLIIAGTPQRLRFDRTTKSFAFDYTAARADGAGRFVKNACTQIAVPRLQYPHGYTVEATGARVVSDVGAGVLSLQATGKTSQIAIRITPTGGSSTGPIRLGAPC